MNTDYTVAQKMETIQSVFREVQDFYSETTQLDNYEIEFRSIAYEAASMCVALNDFKTYDELRDWFVFLKEKGTLHATQIHVGLGWALAQNEIDTSVILPALDSMMRYRVLDGYGYYEGFFRRRKGVLNQQKPELQDTTALLLTTKDWAEAFGIRAAEKLTKQNAPLKNFLQNAMPIYGEVWELPLRM